MTDHFLAVLIQKVLYINDRTRRQAFLRLPSLSKRFLISLKNFDFRNEIVESGVRSEFFYREDIRA